MPVAERPSRTRRPNPSGRKSLSTLLRSVDAYDIPRAKGVATEDAWKAAFERCYAIWAFASEQADKVRAKDFWVPKVDAQGNILVEPNKWFQLEEGLRAELVSMCETAQRFGLAERMVAVSEARAVMVAEAVRGAAADAGLDPEQTQRLGSALRKRLEAGSS